MEISFTLDWASFWIGAVATVVVAFVGAFTAAVIQTRKNRWDNWTASKK